MKPKEKPDKPAKPLKEKLQREAAHKETIMPEATDVQMQHFADERVRPRAEQVRALRMACLDDRAVIDDIYSRAIGSNRWEDNRADGPPHLLQSGDGASPDDMLNYNTFADLFEKFMTGTFSSLEQANSAAPLWAVLQDACVRGV